MPPKRKALLIIDHGRTVFLGTLEEARRELNAAEGSSLEEIFFAATEERAPERPEGGV